MSYSFCEKKSVKIHPFLAPSFVSPLFPFPYLKKRTFAILLMLTFKMNSDANPINKYKPDLQRDPKSGVDY